MRAATEAEIELQILGYLTFKCRHFAWKNNSAGYFDEKTGRFRKHQNPYAINGSPDIYCMLRGVPALQGIIVCFEVKSRVGTQSDDQILFQMRVQEVGGYYFVVRSIEDVEAALLQVYKNEGLMH